MKTEIVQARSLLEEANSIAIVGHIRPDGDAVGSLLALTRSLELIGKKVFPILVDGVPKRFRFLPGAEAVRKKIPINYDLLIAVDCSALDRAGFTSESLPSRIDLNIDHHPTNTYFGVVNLVNPDAAATAEIIFDLSSPLGLPLDNEIATNLFAGLVTDTIGFRTSNVTSKVLEVAARLVDQGAPLAEVYERLLNRRSFTAARYWGCGLSRLDRKDGLVWASLTLEDRQRVGYPGGDDADLINLLSTIEDTLVTVVFIEQPAGKVKVSWRSRKGLNIADLAASFGGGGHAQAAGAIISGELEEVKTKVLSATKAVVHTIVEVGG